MDFYKWKLNMKLQMNCLSTLAEVLARDKLVIKSFACATKAGLNKYSCVRTNTNPFILIQVAKNQQNE